MDVLNEVEVLFTKLEALPCDVKQAAVKKILEKLPNYSVDNRRKVKENVTIRKRSGKRPKEKDEREEKDEYFVENVLTSRGRKAKRICYTRLSKNNYEGEMTAAAGQTLVSNATSLHERKVGENWKLGAPHLKSSEAERDTLKTKLKKECTTDMDDTESSLRNETTEQQLVIIDSVPNKKNNNKEEEEDEDEEEEEENVHDICEQMACTAKENETTDGSSDNKQTYGMKNSSSKKNNLFSCDHCSFQTSNKTLLKSHLHTHKDVRPYTCQDCGKTFLQLSGLKIHMKRHRGQRDFPCDYGCSYRAYTKVDKLRHMTVHTGERSQMCQYCGKSFAKDSTLREHVKSIHERPNKHVCSKCGFSTFRANNLRVHISMRHRGEYNNHVCPVCGAKVKQRTAFLDHMRSHTGERPYRCQICTSSFTCLARLTVHSKAVHGPRQFSCKECSKHFQTKHHLLRHLVIHTNKKPYGCPFCVYTCNTQGNVTKHVKTVHNKPNFSYRRYKADQQVDADAKGVKTEWIEKGEKLTEQYLKELSKKLGRDVTLTELKKQEAEKNKKLNEEVEQVKMKRLNRIRKHEHSYHSNKTSENEIEMDEEAIDDPTTLLLNVAQQNSNDGDNVTKPVNNDIQQGTQILSEMNLNGFKNVNQTIYLQNSEVSDVGELQAILTHSSENNTDPVGMVSDQNIEFCVSNPSQYEEQVPLHVIYHSSDAAGENSQGSFDSEQCDQKFTNNINFVEMKDNTLNPTVVVIINTDNS